MADLDAIRKQIYAARSNLETAVENILWDLGEIGKHRGQQILGDIDDELDRFEELLGDPDA